MSYSSNIVFLLCDVNNNWAKYKCIACKYWQTFFFLLNINNPTLADLYLLYVKLLAFDCPSVREVCQGLADGPELLFSFLKLSVVFKVSGGWQRESIPDPNHKGEQDQRHDPKAPWRTHCLYEETEISRYACCLQLHLCTDIKYKTTRLSTQG